MAEHEERSMASTVPQASGLRKMGYERYLGWPTAACMVRDFVERPEHATKLKTALVTMVSDAENHLNIERESMDTEGEEKDSHAVDWAQGEFDLNNFKKEVIGTIKRLLKIIRTDSVLGRRITTIMFMVDFATDKLLYEKTMANPTKKAMIEEIFENPTEYVIGSKKDISLYLPLLPEE